MVTGITLVMSVWGTMAVRVVAFTKVVDNGLPLNSTVELPLTKPVPVTVNWKPGVPAPIVVGEIELTLEPALKVAVTDLAALMVTVHVPVPLQAPLQPANVEPEAAAAVRVTEVPLLKFAVQVLGQLMPLGLLVTVPLPVPASVTVNAKVTKLNVAVTDLAALIVTVHVPVPVQAPLQPANVEPEAAAAVRVTEAPLLKFALQVVGQLIPAGLLVTVPPPVPASVTVSAKVPTLNVAVTDSAALMVTVHVPVPVQAPLHPANVEPEAAAAVRVTEAPLLKVAVQVLGQLIPAGLLVTVPLPVPASVTVSEEVTTVIVNCIPLLATPPTVTTTLPVVAPVGTVATIDVALQLVIVVAVVPLNVTVLVLCVAPKFVPVIVTDVPTGPEVEDKLVMVGVPVVIVKLKALDVPPPGGGLTTVTATVPGFATSAAVMAAMSCALLTNVVARAEPFHCTCELDTNPLPFTVRLKAPEPAATLDGLVALPAEIVGTGFEVVTMLPELPQAANPRRRAKIGNSWIRRSIAKPLS